MYTRISGQGRKRNDPRGADLGVGVAYSGVGLVGGVEYGVGGWVHHPPRTGSGGK